MSLQFYIGASGTGKSTTLYEDILKQAKIEPFRRFFIIVPDQFTMQTQKVLCHMAEGGGILNVEVLSFGRLTHRIFEELGLEGLPKLDDTGKNLILRKVAADYADQLIVMKHHIKKVGYIAQIKSMISEFAQYGILAEDLTKYCEQTRKRGSLSAKLHDLQILYKGYKQYIGDKFITNEESIELLIKNLHRSDLIQNSVVAFDGFTGFTPIQDRLLQEMMLLCKQVIVTLLADKKEDLTAPDITQSMFYLTAKAYQKLCRLADDYQVVRDQDVVLTKTPVKRYENHKGLSHLEENLFRNKDTVAISCEGEVSVYHCMNPKSELDMVCYEIRRLIREKSYCYRDFAVITGDLTAYGPLLKETFAEHEIPLFLDQNRSLLFHPFMVFLLGIFQVLHCDFSYESVMEFLRVGYFDLEEEQIDRFEKYVLSHGIRGKKKYETPFVGVDAFLEDANKVRESLVVSLSPILNLKKEEKDARNYTKSLYDICVNMQIEEKLDRLSQGFFEKENFSKAKEYDQVYGSVMDLFDQIYTLLDEKLSLDEYSEILKAGFAELQVGSIPQSVDQVIAGDLERTRLKPVKVLFIVGANDGIIPGSSGSGGILSDLERSFLQELGAELAPTPRQKSFEERLYLYMNMTQPSERLVLSFSEVDEGGNQLRPSYLISVVKKLYSDLYVQPVFLNEQLSMVESRESGLKLLSGLLRDYVSGSIEENSPEWNMLFTLAGIFYEDEAFLSLLSSAFFRYETIPLSKETTNSLFGQIVRTSVSRLEQFAACSYGHFLKYGLRLKEENEYTFEITDLGNLYHDLLYRFGKDLEMSGYTWLTYPEEMLEDFIDNTIEEFAGGYHNQVLLDTARNRALKERTKAILRTTLEGLTYHLKKGIFEPACYELPFQYLDDPVLYGKIDRVDIAKDDSRVYVKVLDYKSGHHSFDPARLFYGLDLQLAVYMNAAMARQKKIDSKKEIVPAAFFYYQIKDPILESPISESNESYDRELRKALMVRGLILEDDVVLEGLDQTKEKESTVIPIKYKANGELTSASQTATKKQFDLIGRYVDWKVAKIGEEIRQGKIDINPMTDTEGNACQYCSYKGICGYEKNIPGFKERTMEIKGEQVYEKMEKELGANDIYGGSTEGHRDSES